MRSCEKNKRLLYVLNYKGKVPYVNEEGYETGEEIITYYKAEKFKANISGAKGSSAVEVFGTSLDYDKVFTLSYKEFEDLKITDNSVFFVDTKPTYEESGYPLYDYRVKKIADTPNEVVIALEKVRR
jgi:hypothetical protein